MISSASTLFIASLVFNAASVLGAPIRIPDAGSQVTARTDIPVQPAPPVIVDLQAGHRKRSRVVAIPRARFVAERGLAAVTEAIETRQPLDIAVPAVEKRDEEPTIQRRYPRRVYHDFYEKREPATTVKESTLMITKTTVHDSPADAAAYGVHQPVHPGTGAGAFPHAIPGAPVDPHVPANPQATDVTTLISVSHTTTLAASDAPAATATLPAGGDAPAVPAGGDPAATSTSADTPAATPAPPAGDAPPPPAGGDAPAPPAGGDASASATTTSSASDPTQTPDAGAGAADPATPPAGGAENGGDDKPAGGDDKPASDDKPAGGDDAAATTTSDASPAATPAAGDDATAAGFTAGGARRAVKVSTEPVARRMAYSGAAWASSIRRSLVNSN